MMYNYMTMHMLYMQQVDITISKNQALQTLYRVGSRIFWKGNQKI